MKLGLILLIITASLNCKIVVANVDELRELLNIDNTTIPAREDVASYQNDAGFLQTAVCDAPHGKIPGKTNGSWCWYSWGGKESYVTQKSQFTIIQGKMMLTTQDISKCAASGHQTNDNKNYWSALINGAHGLVPGKYDPPRKMAWYPWGGLEYVVTDLTKVVVVCK